MSTTKITDTFRTGFTRLGLENQYKLLKMVIQKRKTAAFFKFIQPDYDDIDELVEYAHSGKNSKIESWMKSQVSSSILFSMDLKTMADFITEFVVPNDITEIVLLFGKRCKKFCEEERFKFVQSESCDTSSCSSEENAFFEDETNRSSKDSKSDISLVLPNWKADCAGENTPEILCCKICFDKIVDCRLSTDRLMCADCVCNVFSNGNNECPFTKQKVTSVEKFIF